MTKLKERSFELNFFDIYSVPNFMNELLPQLVLFQGFDSIVRNCHQFKVNVWQIFGKLWNVRYGLENCSLSNNLLPFQILNQYRLKAPRYLNHKPVQNTGKHQNKSEHWHKIRSSRSQMFFKTDGRTTPFTEYHRWLPLRKS